MCRFLDCYGLLRFAIDIWAISKTYSDLSIQCRTVTQVHTVLWGYGRHDGSMLSMAQWWTSGLRILTIFLDGWWAPGFEPSWIHTCTHFTLYFVYRIWSVSQKIRSYQHYNIIYHNFPQFPSKTHYFQTFSIYTIVFSIPFQRFPTSKVALMHRPTRASQSVDQKARHVLDVLGPGTWDGFFCSEWDLIHYIIYIFSKGSNFFPTFKSRMYRMFLSFQNLDGNIYSWNLYVWRFLNVASTNLVLPGWGNHCSWLWRSLRMATIWSAWKVGARKTLRDSDWIHQKMGGLSMKSCGSMGLIITNGYTWWFQWF